MDLAHPSPTLLQQPDAEHHLRWQPGERLHHLFEARCDALAREGTFFSSAGGTPVSAVAGTAILDIIDDEGLQQNAARVGRVIADGVRALSERHPLIGAVHGTGLYLGIELVRDRDTLEPARDEAARVCDLLLGRGFIVQAASERQNVLKVKPPLVLTERDARRFVDALDAVLGEVG